MSEAYPRDCPYCGKTLKRASQHDLHMERAHSDEKADRAVAEAILDELKSEWEGDDGDSEQDK